MMDPQSTPSPRTTPETRYTSAPPVVDSPGSGLDDAALGMAKTYIVYFSKLGNTTYSPVWLPIFRLVKQIG